MQKEITAAQALSRLGSLCAAAEQCEAGLRRKMAAWGIAPDDQDTVVDKLRAARFFSDERYARAFAADKLRFDHWGPRKIDQALFAKGIAESVRRDALAQFSDDDFVEILRPMVEARRKAEKEPDEWKARQKLFRWATGRGFTMAQIERCLP